MAGCSSCNEYEKPSETYRGPLAGEYLIVVKVSCSAVMELYFSENG